MKKKKILLSSLLIFTMLTGLLSAGSTAYASEELLLTAADEAEETGIEETGNAENALAEASGTGEYLLWDGGAGAETADGMDASLLNDETGADPAIRENVSAAEQAGNDIPAAEPSGDDILLTEEDILSAGDADLSTGDEDLLISTDEDPAVVSASGTVKASSLSENSELNLTGNTTLVMDTARTLKSISGSHALTVQGSKALTVKNSGGHAISVKSITSSAPMNLSAGGNGLNIEENIELSGAMSVSSSVDGIYSRKGKLTMSGDAVIKAVGSAVKADRGGIIITGNLTAESYGSESPCISAGSISGTSIYIPDITITSEKLNITSAGSAIYSFASTITLSGNASVISKNYTAIVTVSIADEYYGKVILNGSLEAQGKNYGISTGDIMVTGGPVIISASKQAIYSGTKQINVLHPLFIAEPVSGKISGNTIVDSNGKDAAYVRIVNSVLPQNSTVVYTSGARVGEDVTIARTGELATLYGASPNKLHYQWQISNDGETGWKDITGATKASYKPVAADVGKYIRIAVTADGYTGTVYSVPKQVTKAVNTGSPVSPLLSVKSPYSSVTVTNAKALQEYTLGYSIGNPDWSKAKSPAKDGTLSLPADKDRTVYVHTRMKETASAQAGTTSVYRKVYNGYVTYLMDLNLNHTSVVTKVGEVTALTVSPVPEEFTGWDEYTVSWFVNGSGVSLYADAKCSITLTQHSPIKNKTVYAKGTAQTRFVQVGVEKQVGYTDLRTAFCSFEVADANGNFLLDHLNFDDVSIRPGETVTVSYTTSPSPAVVSGMSFIKTQGPSDLKVTGSINGTVTVTAPANAPLGTYYYQAQVNSAGRLVKSTIKIMVVSKDHAAVCPSVKFKDVPPLGSAWYHEDVDYVLEKGYMTGVSADSFAPNKTLTRAMVVTILYRMAGEPAVSGSSGFTDVPDGKWYSKAVTWAKNKGIATGYDQKTFGPDDPVTREQMITFLYRFAGKPSGTGSLTGFPDAGKVSSWAVDAMKWAIGKGIIKGNSDGTLNPKGTATRAQFAAIVHRYKG